MKIDFNNYNVEFYFSFRNPYSYLAWTMLKKLMQDKKDALKPIEISAVNLDPKASYRPFWSDLRWKNRMIGRTVLPIIIDGSSNGSSL